MSQWQERAGALRERLITWRRDFHRHPELAFEERRTAGIVASHLASLGWEVKTEVATTGVVGLLCGSRPGPTVMFRFDMDALSITEETGAGYSSTVRGKMHACGHDGHVAMGMGLAQLLIEHRGELKGSVKLVFQPAEEGGNGAERMIQAGVLEFPRPDVVVCCHLWSLTPVGTIDVCDGPVMAACDDWQATVTGRGGHAAMPDTTVDPVVIAAHIVTALQSIVSRNVSPQDPGAVVTVSSIHGGESFNVIPAQVEIRGTLRTFLPSTRELVVRRVGEVVDAIATGLGGSADLDVRFLTPAVVNDPAVAETISAAAAAVVGADHVTCTVHTMGSEDAAYYLSQVPGCYFFIGARNEKLGITAAHHNPRFDIDEESLVLGLAVLGEVAGRYLC